RRQPAGPDHRQQEGHVRLSARDEKSLGRGMGESAAAGEVRELRRPAVEAGRSNPADGAAPVMPGGSVGGLLKPPPASAAARCAGKSGMGTVRPTAWNRVQMPNMGLRLPLIWVVSFAPLPAA